MASLRSSEECNPQPSFYGENASGTTPPSTTALTGASYGYNGAQGKLTNTASGITLMGDRPYQATIGRFLQIDPIEGGCANNYTYGFGDPLNHPDLSGEGGCHHSFWGSVLGDISTVTGFLSIPAYASCPFTGVGCIVGGALSGVSAVSAVGAAAFDCSGGSGCESSLIDAGVGILAFGTGVGATAGVIRAARGAAESDLLLLGNPGLRDYYVGSLGGSLAGPIGAISGVLGGDTATALTTHRC